MDQLKTITDAASLKVRKQYQSYIKIKLFDAYQFTGETKYEKNNINSMYRNITSWWIRSQDRSSRCNGK